MNLAIIEKIILDYIAKHPELIEQLLERLMTRLLDHLARPDAQ